MTAHDPQGLQALHRGVRQRMPLVQRQGSEARRSAGPLMLS